MLAQIDMLFRRPIASEAMAVSTRSRLNVTSEAPANADCSALANRSNSACARRSSMFENTLDVQRRLGAIGAEHRLDHGEHKVAVEPMRIRASQAVGIEHRRDRHSPS